MKKSLAGKLLGALVAALLICLAPLIHATCASVMNATAGHSMPAMHHTAMHSEGLTQWVAPVVMDMPHSVPNHMLGMPENAGQTMGVPAALSLIGLMLIVWLKRVRPVHLSRWFSSLLDPPGFTPPAFAAVDLTKIGISRT